MSMRDDRRFRFGEPQIGPRQLHFPSEKITRACLAGTIGSVRLGGWSPGSARAFHAAVNTIMSRRIKDLAREFNCLGFFDDDDDRPRAA